MKSLYLSIIVTNLTEQDWKKVCVADLWEGDTDYVDGIGTIKGIDTVTNRTKLVDLAKEIVEDIISLVGRSVPVTIIDGNGVTLT